MAKRKILKRSPEVKPPKKKKAKKKKIQTDSTRQIAADTVTNEPDSTGLY